MANAAVTYVRIPIGFEPDSYEWLRETAHVQRTSIADLVREAVQKLRAERDQSTVEQSHDQQLAAA